MPQERFTEVGCRLYCRCVRASKAPFAGICGAFWKRLGAAFPWIGFGVFFRCFRARFVRDMEVAGARMHSRPNMGRPCPVGGGEVGWPERGLGQVLAVLAEL